jgi:hypothetical protein
VVVVGVLLVTGATQGLAAPHASVAARPRGAPDLALMALQRSDFSGGARIDTQGYKRDPDYVADFVRDFKPGARFGKSRSMFVESEVMLFTSTDEATSFVDFVRGLVSSKQGRAKLAKEAASGAGLGEGAKFVFGPPRPIATGDQSLYVPATATALGVPIRFAMAMTRVDRVVSAVLVGGLQGSLFAGDVGGLLRKTAAHTRSGLVPTILAAPTITGTAQVGQALTSTAGTWTNSPMSFVYRWTRCDAAGASCAPIGGATSSTYPLTTDDVGATIRVSVTASNRVGSSSASSSAQTEAVKPPPAVALDGHYCGATDQGQSMCFDILGGGKTFANAQFGAIVDCQPPGQFEVTSAVAESTAPIASNLTFTWLKPSGHMAGSRVTGTLNTAGGATGTLTAKAAFSYQGTHYDCQAPTSAWSAKRQS